ncbi:MAG: alpha/beta hydrolase, partial [Planctomycetota bacterium]
SENIFDALGIADTLCECGPGANQIVPRLIEAIDETSFDGRAHVLRLLGELGKSQADEVAPLLFSRLMDSAEDVLVRVAAARGLGKLGPAAVQLIADVLRDGDEANQLIAARALVEIGPTASPAKAALHELLAERRADNELRALCAVALGQLGSEATDTAPALTELLRDPQAETYLRSMCAVALGQVDPSALPVLESMLDDPDADVQIASAYALCKIDPRHVRGLATLAHWLESDEYRGSAITALVDVGETALACVVAAMNDSSKSRDTRVACLEVLSAFDEQAITPLMNALNDEAIAEDAGWTLRDRGNALLPTLIAGMEDESRFTPQARAIMGNVIEDMFSGVGAGDGGETWEGGHALVRRPEPEAMAKEAASAMIGDPMLDEGGSSESTAPEPVENPGTAIGGAPIKARGSIVESPPLATGYKTVDVFYGTNRKPTDETSAATASRGRRWFWWAAIVLSLVVVTLIIMFRRGAKRQATVGLAGTILVLILGLMIFAPTVMRSSIDKSGPRYGGKYSEQVEMGICQVTIPDTHRAGELEAPPLRLEFAEDLQKHIVLRSVQRLQPDAFFAGLQKELHGKGNNILVFIHGYNVSFEDAARRTAQMSADLKFAGAPVFYSWPSQAEVLKYRMDEKNVELSVDQLKSFLLAVAERSGADTINLVAHSMGNRVLTDALKEMDVVATAQKQLFN